MKQFNILPAILTVAGALVWFVSDPVLAQSKSGLNLEQRIELVKDLYRERHFVEAHEEARSIVEVYQEHPEAWFWLGLTAREDNRDEEALNAFRRAIALKEDYAEAHGQLAQLYSQQEQWKKAIETYQKGVQIRPNWAPAYSGLGEIYCKNGWWKRAVENYEKALELDPANPRAKAFIEPCKKALEEQERLGYVLEETLRQIAVLLRTGGKRGIGPLPSQVPLHIEFGYGKHAFSDLSANGREQLKQGAMVLQSPEWQGRKIAIEGHTCSCGSQQGNKRLARQRAETVRDYLIDQGFVPAEDVSLIVCGEERPISASPYENLPPAQCEMDEMHSMDRRVVIREWSGEESAALPELVAQSPSAASAQVSFWYRRGSKGKFRKLEDGEVLRFGDELRLFLISAQPVYAYVFHHGSEGNWICLFPNEQFSLEAPAENPLEPGRKYWLPRFGSGIPLDDVPGREETFVYLSPHPDPEMEKWVKEGVSKIKTRGLGGIVSDIDWFARVQFHHER